MRWRHIGRQFIAAPVGSIRFGDEFDAPAAFCWLILHYGVMCVVLWSLPPMLWRTWLWCWQDFHHDRSPILGLATLDGYRTDSTGSIDLIFVGSILEPTDSIVCRKPPARACGQLARTCHPLVFSTSSAWRREMRVSC
jgi:hypothetical protein